MSKPKVIFHKFKMYVPDGRECKIIPYANILFLQASGQYTQLNLRDCKTPRFVYESLTELECFLPSVFYRCHRSVIVNLCYIESFSKEGILIGSHNLPVSGNKLEEMNYLLKENEVLTFPQCNNCINCLELENCKLVRPFTAIKITR